MVQFVKPNLLGDKKEFHNRFVNPIVNGQYRDSTPLDVHLMRNRSHVLHKMLDGTVQVNLQFANTKILEDVEEFSNLIVY